MVVAVAAVAFSACEKESAFLADVTYPEEGTGNATVTVSVQNNTRSKRKTGHLTIVFPDHNVPNYGNVYNNTMSEYLQ